MIPIYRTLEEPARPTLPRPQPGSGSLLTTNALGSAWNVPRGGATFNHAWRPALQGLGVVLRVGFLDGIYEPTIKTRDGQRLPMSGKDGRSPVTLPLDPDEANEDGESWVMLEATPDDKGLLSDKSRIELIHSGDPKPSVDPLLARTEITQILWQSGRPTRAIAIVCFNLRYEISLPTPGGGTVRHLFR